MYADIGCFKAIAILCGLCLLQTLNLKMMSLRLVALWAITTTAKAKSLSALDLDFI